jgi:hypothetical protein
MKKKIVSLTDEQAEWVATTAEQLGVSRSKLMCDVVAAHIAEMERRDPKFAATVADARANAADTKPELGSAG